MEVWPRPESQNLTKFVPSFCPDISRANVAKIRRFRRPKNGNIATLVIFKNEMKIDQLNKMK